MTYVPASACVRMYALQTTLVIGQQAVRVEVCT